MDFLKELGIDWKYTDDKVWTILVIATLPMFYILPKMSQPASQYVDEILESSDAAITLMGLYSLFYVIGVAVTAVIANKASGELPRENRRNFDLLELINWLEDEVEGRKTSSGTYAPNLKHQAELTYLKEKYKSQLGGLSSVREAHKKRQQAYFKSRETRSNEIVYGARSKEIVCPHCQKKGKVRKTSKEITEESREKGIIGATIGRKTITKKGSMTQLHCDNCDTTWTA